MTGKPRQPANGLRNVQTLQTMSHGTRSKERHHLVSRFARLETERARLEREVEMWDARKRATEAKLTKVREQLAELQALLLEEPGKVTAARKVRGHGRPRASTEVAGTTAPPSRNFSLEY